jgi:hypothetical protein
MDLCLYFFMVKGNDDLPASGSLFSGARKK